MCLMTKEKGVESSVTPANNPATVNSDLTSHKHKPIQRRVLCFTNTSVSTNTNTQYTPKRFTDKARADEVLLPKNETNKCKCIQQLKSVVRNSLLVKNKHLKSKDMNRKDT